MRCTCRNGTAQQAVRFDNRTAVSLITPGWSAEAVSHCTSIQFMHTNPMMLSWLLQELHTRYFEPLSIVPPTLEAMLAGPPVKKLLFMTDPSVVDSQLKPHWQVRQANLQQTGAS